MSDVMSPEPTGQGEAPAEAVELLSAGALLRRAREAAGLHVAALAVTMKVPVKKLEALENDRLDLLPDAVFVRALASSVCRTLKLDPAPILAKLPQTSTPKLDTEQRGINAPFHAPGENRQWTVPEFFTRPAVLAVVGLMLAALILILWPASEPAKEVPVASPSTPLFPPGDAPSPTGALAPANTLAEPAAAVAVPTPLAQPSTSVAPAAAQPASPAPGAGVATAAPEPAKAAPAAAPVTASSGTAQTAVPNAGIVSFQAKGTSWVEVRDANGVTQLRKTLFNGESVQSGGALPLTVVIGRADVTTVEVRGKPYSLTSVSVDNVARFEVK